MISTNSYENEAGCEFCMACGNELIEPETLSTEGEEIDMETGSSRSSNSSRRALQRSPECGEVDVEERMAQVEQSEAAVREGFYAKSLRLLTNSKVLAIAILTSLAINTVLFIGLCLPHIFFSSIKYSIMYKTTKVLTMCILRSDFSMDISWP